MKIPLIIIITLLNLSNIYASTNNWDGYVQTKPALAKYSAHLKILKKEREELRQCLQNTSHPSEKIALISTISDYDRQIKATQDILDKCFNYYIKTHPQTNSIINNETNLKRKQK